MVSVTKDISELLPRSGMHESFECGSLLQFRVLGFGLFEDGDVGVGVFPEGEEIFVGSERPDVGGIGIGPLRGSRLQGIRTSHPQMRQCSRPAVPYDADVVENLLKLGSGLCALSRC